MSNREERLELRLAEESGFSPGRRRSPSPMTLNLGSDAATRRRSNTPLRGAGGRKTSSSSPPPSVVARAEGYRPQTSFLDAGVNLMCNTNRRLPINGALLSPSKSLSTGTPPSGSSLATPTKGGKRSLNSAAASAISSLGAKRNRQRAAGGVDSSPSGQSSPTPATPTSASSLNNNHSRFKFLNNKASVETSSENGDDSIASSTRLEALREQQNARLRERQERLARQREDLTGVRLAGVDANMIPDSKKAPQVRRGLVVYLSHCLISTFHECIECIEEACTSLSK